MLERWRLPFLAIPADLEQGALSWTAWNESERQQLRSRLAETLLKILDPAVIVFDCLPSLSIASAALAQGRRIVLCVRAVKDFNYYRLRVGPVLAAACRILFPHEPDEWTVPTEFLPKARFVGTIHHTPLLNSRTVVEPRFDVIVTAGGGGFAGTVEFYNLALRAFTLCRTQNLDLSCFLITGPLFKDWRRLRIVPGVVVSPFEDDMASLFAKAGLVICQGGYNTLAELAALEVPSICLPAERTFDNQTERAKLLSTNSHWLAVHSRGVTADQLEITIHKMLRLDQTRRSSPHRFGGAAAAAKAILEVLR
jgi:UDP-N-acetylglucosamine:LPS N-acetylglucosamine transferase